MAVRARPWTAADREIARLLTENKEARKWSFRTIEEKSGINYVRVRDISNAVHGTPTVSEFLAICEAFGVDFARHRLSVKRSATTVGRKVVVDLPKNGKPRQVVFPRVLERPLREQCAGRDGGEPLFPGRDGGYLVRAAPPNDKTKWFWWAKKRAGVPMGLTYHDLRHTAASLMVSSGANVKAVQTQLGHASAAMTLDVYADLFDDDLDAVGRAMDSMLLREDVVKMLPNGASGAA